MALDLPHSQFFHIQKTGGMWVRQALQNVGIVVSEIGATVLHDVREPEQRHALFIHARPCQIAHSNKFRFAFVRNPLTWYQSMYAYQASNNWSRSQFSQVDSFVEFMEWILREQPGYVSRLYRWCKDVDFMGRFESLEDDLVTALRMAGETFDEASLRATPPQNTASSLPEWKGRCTYTEDLRRRVVESEHKAFEQYGFDPYAVHIAIMQ